MTVNSYIVSVFCIFKARNNKICIYVRMNDYDYYE